MGGGGGFSFVKIWQVRWKMGGAYACRVSAVPVRNEWIER